jgi:hypothetical protein
MFSKFMVFLKSNNVYNERSYNELYYKNINWMPPIGSIRERYHKFCFKNIHPDNNKYYEDKDTAITNFNKSKIELKNKIGLDKYSDLANDELIKQINTLIDNKIPPIDFDFYYPISN